jgi:hypothetical protein
MRVIVVHGSVKYEGKRYAPGDELSVSERYFATNPGRFEAVAAGEIQVLNEAPPPPKAKRKTKAKPEE